MRRVIAITAFVGALASSVLALAAVPAPSPSPIPKEVKVRTASTLLIESPELFEECRAAHEKHDELLTSDSDWEGDRERAAAAYKPASKPVDDMTAEELKAWKAAREKLSAEQDAIMARHHRAVKALAEVEEACAPAAMGVLLKGAILSVLREKGVLLNVRVETGRAAGKVGWVLRSEVAVNDAK
jgi:hypothetical protein